MHKLFMGLTVAVCFVIASANPAIATGGRPSFEVGGVYTIIQLTDFQSRDNSQWSWRSTLCRD
jgi:hypothetical protein